MEMRRGREKRTRKGGVVPDERDEARMGKNDIDGGIRIHRLILRSQLTMAG